MSEHIDVIIVGAGLSGISAAYHLQTRCPDKTFAILEARDNIGGTWDLFRYPGVRSDSDMFTLGYRWRPWPGAKAIADGPSILTYVRDAARERDLAGKIRFHHCVRRASWSSERARWTLEIAHGPERTSTQLSCNFLYVCAGYYDYAAGYTPDFPGLHDFAGRVVHPQHWPADLTWAGKRVVVIGSGATAVTLVPALAEQAQSVVMLQRSPSYLVSMPARDSIADALRRRLPPRAAYGVARWKNIAFGAFYYALTRRAPQFAKRSLLQGVRAALGPAFDVDKHFTPSYGVWDQRLCLVPDGDFFEALRGERASVVTDHIERFTKTGVALRSGQELPADIIVTATGLELQFLGGMQLEVDGRALEMQHAMSYKGCMICDVPNLVNTFGYTNASWTLKADLTAEYVCRLLRELAARKATTCTPRLKDARVHEQPFIDFTSGYVQRGLSRFPKQGSRRPFRLYQNYALDLLTLRYGRIADGTLEFTHAQPRPTQAKPAPRVSTNSSREQA